MESLNNQLEDLKKEIWHLAKKRVTDLEKLLGSADIESLAKIKEEVEKLSALPDAVDSVQTSLKEMSSEVLENSHSIKDLKDSKVDKIDGKTLTSNDFSDEEKAKLAGIEEGANKFTLPNDLAKDGDVVHIQGDENILGNKKFDNISVKASDNSFKKVLTSAEESETKEFLIGVSDTIDNQSKINQGVFMQGGKIYSGGKEVAAKEDVDTLSSSKLSAPKASSEKKFLIGVSQEGETESLLDTSIYEQNGNLYLSGARVATEVDSSRKIDKFATCSLPSDSEVDLNDLYSTMSDQRFWCKDQQTSQKCTNKPEGDTSPEGFTVETFMTSSAESPFRTYRQNYTSNNGIWTRTAIQNTEYVKPEWSEWLPFFQSKKLKATIPASRVNAYLDFGNILSKSRDYFLSLRVSVTCPEDEVTRGVYVIDIYSSFKVTISSSHQFDSVEPPIAEIAICRPQDRTSNLLDILSLRFGTDSSTSREVEIEVLSECGCGISLSSPISTKFTPATYYRYSRYPTGNNGNILANADTSTLAEKSNSLMSDLTLTLGQALDGPRLLAKSTDDKLYDITSSEHSFYINHPIYYYSSEYKTQENMLIAENLFLCSLANLYDIYNQTFSVKKSLYLSGDLSNELFTPDGSFCQESGFVEGKYYIWLGYMETFSTLKLEITHPVYIFKDGELKRIDKNLSYNELSDRPIKAISFSNGNLTISI